MMLEEILMYLNNWFVTSVYTGTYTIEDGTLSLPSLYEDQYYRIIGSARNDGLHQAGDALKDETFTGAIWTLAIPEQVLTLASEVEAWQAKYGESVSGPYASESFGGYSYSKQTASDGKAATWATAFESRLAPYRKLRETSAVRPAGRQDPPFIRPFNPGGLT